MDFVEKINKIMDKIISLSNKRSVNAVKILSLLLSEDRPSFSLREIAQTLDLPENTVAVQLHFLVKQGLVKRLDRGRYAINARPLLLFLLAMIISAPQPNSLTKKFRQLLAEEAEKGEREEEGEEIEEEETTEEEFQDIL
ncbi:MAG: helix-turn-helix domain-containing protein [Candidatus Korarchaeota archaeon]